MNKTARRVIDYFIDHDIRTQANFWHKDVIPVYKSDDTEEYYFSGKRIHRGQYRTASGQVLNADVNGALNIMRKSSVVDVNILYSRGEVDTPIRIRIAQQQVET